MADKILSAQQLLKLKGFEINKFNTNLFMQDVADYFLKNEVSAKLLLLPLRFVDVPNEENPETNPLRITEEDRKNGFKTQTKLIDTLEDEKTRRSWEISRGLIKGLEFEYIFYLYEHNTKEFRSEYDRKILVPRIVVDKPFIGNAVHTLRLLGGYVVEQKVRKKLKTYDISLL